jgi:hypothetical protein
MSSIYNISHSTVHIHECNCNNSRGLKFTVPHMSTGAYYSTGPHMSTESCCSTGTCLSTNSCQVLDNMEIDNNDNLI